MSKVRQARPALTLAAIGVVFGDIGTSPLYVVRECFRTLAPAEAHILGVASLIFWSLTMLVSVKYVTCLLRATSHGEGGIFALFALCRENRSAKPALFAAGAIAGAALLFSDGMITPAISVLSAVEGLEQISPSWGNAVLPITCGILAILFLAQPLGTGRLGRGFGFVMVPWFLCIGAVGLVQIVQTPEILRGLNPIYGIRLLVSGEIGSLGVLGGVLLCITGAEALYADVGHFGKRAIRIGWWGLVKPCLLASYLGQLGWLLHHSGNTATATPSPFFAIVPAGFEIGFVLLSTAATVIASQALISGVFSLAEQGIRLGFLPRLHVVHTSTTERGQVYLPKINWLLMAACITLVLGFRSSNNLASAYGLAVVTGMGITSLFYLYHIRKNQAWPLVLAISLAGIWLVLELALLLSASEKFLSGAWLPALITIALVVIMQTWRWGSRRLRRFDAGDQHTPLSELIAPHNDVPRIGGCARNHRFRRFTQTRTRSLRRTLWHATGAAAVALRGERTRTALRGRQSIPLARGRSRRAEPTPACRFRRTPRHPRRDQLGNRTGQHRRSPTGNLLHIPSHAHRRARSVS